MFKKEGEKMANEGKMNSIFGKGCKISGTVEVKEGTLRIDGEFEGNVDCPGTLVVGKGGNVKADIKVKNVVVGGTVVGNIEADEKIELQAGSRLEGDIKTKRLVIDEGVFFEGSCNMSPEGGVDKGKSEGNKAEPIEKMNKKSSYLDR
ncbi:MAG: polymer-forming cytoskeletal protein [Candidatus Krumholzibacteriota bacterium]|nr:polymer-forming cytoskeletal protein [Candidatus Krumholzibacteriota bacterium]